MLVRSIAPVAAATLVVANVALAGNPQMEISALAGGDLATGKTIVVTLDDGDPRSNREKPSPRLWIEEAFAGTTASGRPNCEDRAVRLAGSGILDPATRDFNMLHVAALTASGVHVLDPRGGLRGARSLAFVELGGRPGKMMWSQSTGLLWITLPEAGEAVAVDVGSWTVSARHALGGRPLDIVEIAPGATRSLVEDGAATRVVGFEPSGSSQTLPAQASRLSVARGRNLVAHGAGAIVLLEAGKSRHIDADLRDSHFIPAADAVFGTDASGRLAFATLDGQRGLVADAELLLSPRLWAAPNGRVIVAWDPAGNLLGIVDTATRSLIRTLAADRPRSIAGSDSSLFVRTAGRGETMVLPLTGLLEGEPIAPRYIAGGDIPSPGRSSLPVTATPEGVSAWIDTERGQIYIYHEGMNVPSATMRLPDPSTSELALIGPLVRPGTDRGFSASARLEKPGDYVAVAKGLEPRYTICTEFTIVGDGKAGRLANSWRVRLEPPAKALTLGREAQFELAIEADSKAPGAYAESIGLLVMEGSGLGQQRLRALHVADGRYIARFTPSRAGAFLLVADRATLPEQTLGRLVTSFEVKP